MSDSPVEDLYYLKDSRLKEGDIIKRYVEAIPSWASRIIPE